MKKVQKLEVIKEEIKKQKSTGMVNAVMNVIIPELKPVQTFALSYLLHGAHAKKAIDAMGWVLQEGTKEGIKKELDQDIPEAKGFYTSDSITALYFQLKDTHLATIEEVAKDPKGLNLLKAVLLNITENYEYIS